MLYSILVVYCGMKQNEKVMKNRFQKEDKIMYGMIILTCTVIVIIAYFIAQTL